MMFDWFTNESMDMLCSLPSGRSMRCSEAGVALGDSGTTEPQGGIDGTGDTVSLNCAGCQY
jgi:hypothetical protein